MTLSFLMEAGNIYMNDNTCLGSRALGELVASMSDPELGDRSQDREPPLVKSESSASGPPPAPGLIPLARPDTAASVMSAEKQQVQAAMAMAAFYSQNPLWQAAMARERLQQQQQQLGAAAAALSQLPGRPP